MGKICKTFALLLTLIIAMSCLTSLIVKPANAKTIPKPSVPEFTAKYVDQSYTVPARTYIDHYTGEQVTDPSYIVENKTITITIKNQLFVSNEEIAYLCYNIREKGHFGNANWTELYHITNQTNDNTLFRASNSDYTIISLPKTAPNGGQIDFQVKAYFTIGHRFFNTNFGTWTWEESDWSPTQKVTIPAQSSTITPTTPSSTGSLIFDLAIPIIAVVLLVVAIISIFLFRRHRKTTN